MAIIMTAYGDSSVTYVTWEFAYVSCSRLGQLSNNNRL